MLTFFMSKETRTKPSQAMWEFRWRWGHEKDQTQSHQHHHNLLILQNDGGDDENNFDFDPTATITSAAMALTTWLLRRRRRRNLLLLALLSPILLPFLCAAFPLLCTVELYLLLRDLRCHRRRRRMRKPASDGPGRCEEGEGGEFTESEVGGDSGEVRVLLQRYLEDQLVLVGSVYDCGKDDDVFCSDDELLEDCECFDSMNPV